MSDLAETPDNLGEPEILAAVDRTMRTIEMLADASDGLSISAIARSLDVNKQIAARILNTLLIRGYIFQLPNQSYKLTYKVSNIAFRQQITVRLSDQCLPLLQKLADETGELVRLAVVENQQPIWLLAVVGKTQHTRLRLEPAGPNDVLPHAHAVGKVMLSSLSDAEIKALLGAEPYPSETPHTITTWEALIADVHEATRVGYAVSCEEAELGIVAVAAPVKSEYDGKLKAIVSVAAPSPRADRKALVEMSPKLLAVAQQLGEVWPLILQETT